MKLSDQKLINPLLHEVHTRQIEELLSTFPVLNTADGTQFLSLRKYLEARPQRYFSTETFELFLNRLVELDSENKDALLQVLDNQKAAINNAYRHVNEICEYDWHDGQSKDSNSYNQLISIDQNVHPAYLRLTEAVLRPLLRIAAHFSRLDRGKNVGNLELYDTVSELKSTEFENVLSPYDHLMRNSIAHGGITYLADSVVYEDKKGNRKELHDYEVIQNFDNLLDVCNGLLLAFSVFILTRKDDRHRLPVNLLIEELKAETRTPYWDVVGCLPSTQKNGTQLIIYVHINTLDIQKVRFSLFQTAIMAEKIAPGYDRYFFSLRSSNCLPGFAAFDGGKLANHREMNNSIDHYNDVLENNLLFFIPKFRLPSIIGKIETLWLSYKVSKPMIASNLHQQLGLINLAVRNTKIHRNAWGVVLNADVVAECETSSLDQVHIRRNCRRIVKKSLKEARATLSVFSVSRYLPLGFARVHVFQRDYRTHRLSNFGLAKDLVCTVQVQRIRRIKSPDILGSTIEITGRYRIAWNRRWLEYLNADTSVTF